MTSNEREPLAQRIEREFAQAEAARRVHGTWDLVAGPCGIKGDEEPADSDLSLVNRTLTLYYEARFFFVDDPRQRVNPTPLGAATTADRSDDNLRNLAYKLIREDPTGLSVDLAEKKLVVVDVGLHKDSGGLGASIPDETLILLRPA